MKKVDINKRMREIKWTTEHTLSADQLKQLVMQKMERARKDTEARNKAFTKLHV